MTRRTLTALFALAALTVTACGSGADQMADYEASVSSGGRGGAPAPAAEMDYGDYDTGAYDDSYDAADYDAEYAEDSAGAPAPAADRQVIRTARVALEVDDPSATYDLIISRVEQLGGFVSNADLSRNADGVLTGYLTVRLPAEELLGLVEELDAAAVAVPVKQIDTSDVTDRLTDLDAQLTNLRRYEAELQDLLGDVQGIPEVRSKDLLDVFEQLRRIREEIERTEAVKSSLADQVALSTLNVELRTHRQATPVADPTWSFSETVRTAWGSAVAGLRGLVELAVWLVVAALPVVALPALALALAWKAARRRRRSARVEESQLPPPPAAPPGD